MKKILLLLSLLITNAFCYAMNIGDTQRFIYKDKYSNYDLIEEYNGGKSVTIYGTTWILKGNTFGGGVEFYLPNEIGFDCNNLNSIVAINKTIPMDREFKTNYTIFSATIHTDCSVQILRQADVNYLPDQEVSFIIKGQLK